MSMTIENDNPKNYLSICQAIARMEGFYVHHSRAARNHNPGNIEFGSFATQHGAIDSDGRFAIFPSDEIGFSCMAILLFDKYKNLTIAEAINKWAPSTENNTINYIHNICTWTGLESDTIIDAYISNPRIVSAQAQTTKEA